MKVACPDTLRLARRLAVVAHLPESGSVVIADTSADRLLYGDLIIAHRGTGVSVATLVCAPGCVPKVAEDRGLPVFDDRRLKAADGPVRPAPAYPASFTHGDTQLHIGADGAVSTTRL